MGKPMKKKGKKAVGRRTQETRSPRRTARKKSRTMAKAAVRKKSGKETAPASKKRSRAQVYVVDTLVGLDKEPRAPSGLQSGDLQGLSNDEVVDSQSVDELLEEGNAFEAGVVAGVEDSKDAGTSEVRTREVPVDDVPREYLDRD